MMVAPVQPGVEIHKTAKPRTGRQRPVHPSLRDCGGLGCIRPGTEVPGYSHAVPMGPRFGLGQGAAGDSRGRHFPPLFGSCASSRSMWAWIRAAAFTRFRIGSSLGFHCFMGQGQSKCGRGLPPRKGSSSGEVTTET